MIARGCMGRHELTPDEVVRPGFPGLSLADMLVQVFSFSPLPSRHPRPLVPSHLTPQTTSNGRRRESQIMRHEEAHQAVVHHVVEPRVQEWDGRDEMVARW